MVIDFTVEDDDVSTRRRPHWLMSSGRQIDNRQTPVGEKHAPLRVRPSAPVIRAAVRDPSDDRVRVKDDFKLIAQCQCDAVSHVFSEDASTLTKYVERMREAGDLGTRAVLLRDGFDAAWFESGQTRLVP